MIVALYILIAMIVVGTILYLFDRKVPVNDFNHEEQPRTEPACCGLHLVCEKDLPKKNSLEIEYYDDEELDVFRGISPDEYSDKDIEQFRDILLTLLPSDIAGWANSIQMRGIQLPDVIRDELLIIVSEARQKTA